MTVKRFGLLCVVLLYAAALGCMRQPEVFVTRVDAGLDFKNVAICPIQVAQPENVKVRIGEKDPITPAAFYLYFDNAPRSALAMLLEQELLKTKKFKVVGALKTGNAFGEMVAVNQTATLVDVVKLLGSRLCVEVVVVGYLYRWQELEGSWYAARRPAVVAFEFHLYRASDGQIIWRGVFDQAQESLLDNIFGIGKFIRRGGQWISAEQLARDGIEEIVADLSH